MKENRKTYADVLEHWTNFCLKNDLKLKTTRKSDITSGGAIQFLFFEATNDSKTITVFQSFIQADSWLEFIETPHKLILKFESHHSQDLHLSIWEKTKFERFFKRNMIISGNNSFDNRFSGNSNDKVFMNNFFEDSVIQHTLLSDRLMLLGLTTKNDTLKICLKNVHETYYSTDLLEHNYHFFKRIVDRVLSLV